jgi:predicted transcriptional regulator
MVSTRKPLRRINQNIPGDLYDRLAATAMREDRTKSAVLVRALEVYVGVSERLDARRGLSRISRETAQSQPSLIREAVDRPLAQHPEETPPEATETARRPRGRKAGAR